MKIAYRGGHNEQAIGSVGLVNEVTENRKILPFLDKYLRSLGHDVLNVTPGRTDSDTDLVQGVSKASSWGADVFVSIHFNKAYSSYDGKIGTECWVYSKSDNLDDSIGTRIVNNIGNLGFINRGLKEETSFYELRVCKQKGINAVIVEVCFVEATEDVALYKKLGPEKIAKAIAEGIANKSVTDSGSNTGGSSSNNVAIDKGVVNAKEGVNVRKGPGTEYGIIKAIPYKRNVDIYQKSGNWYKVNDGSVEGWASCDYISITAENPPVVNKPNVRYLHLPKDATGWNVYPVNKAPIVGNECGRLLPSKYGGLTYEIKGSTQTDVYLIDTESYGRVQIYAAPSTGAVIKGESQGSTNVQKYGITTDILNVRSGPSTNHKIIGQLKKGETVKLFKKSGAWWDIFYGNNGGYVHGDYIKIK